MKSEEHPNIEHDFFLTAQLKMFIISFELDFHDSIKVLYRLIIVHLSLNELIH